MLAWLKDAILRESDACTEWPGNLTKSGYGVVTFAGKNRTTHRVAYTLARGDIPGGLHVLHSCDNRKCVNPRHLHLGTHQDNVREMVQRGRFRRADGDYNPSRTHPDRQIRGESHHNAKLTEAQARSILSLKGVVTVKQAAKEAGISASQVRQMWEGKAWAHLSR